MAILTKRVIIKALRESRGNISAAARALQVDRRTVAYHINKDERLQRAVIEGREERLDIAESALDDSVKDKQGWAVCFFLKTQGRGRGYIERQELTGPEGRPIQFVVGVNEADVLGPTAADLANVTVNTTTSALPAADIPAIAPAGPAPGETPTVRSV